MGSIASRGALPARRFAKKETPKMTPEKGARNDTSMSSGDTPKNEAEQRIHPMPGLRGLDRSSVVTFRRVNIERRPQPRR
jgi:hypothetical protein